MHHLPVPELPAHLHDCQVGDHLVDIHLGGGTGSGLKDIDGKLVIVRTGENRFAGLANRQGSMLIEKPELFVSGGAGRLPSRLKGPISFSCSAMIKGPTPWVFFIPS